MMDPTGLERPWLAAEVAKTGFEVAKEVVKEVGEVARGLKKIPEKWEPEAEPRVLG